MTLRTANALRTARLAAPFAAFVALVSFAAWLASSGGVDDILDWFGGR